MDAVVNLCKRRGFAFPCSEIYGGMATGWDLGPLGSQLRKNVMDVWWREFVEARPDCVGLDTCTILHPRVWEASGHLTEFVDPLSECAACQHRARADKLLVELGVVDEPTADSLDSAGLGRLLREHQVACPSCGAQGSLGEPRLFNLLFRTSVGPVEGADSVAYLRPETAQGAYTQFGNVQSVLRGRMPCGVAQMGRSFRNEISTHHFLFRTREFDQAELQYFCTPETADEHFARWVDDCHAFLVDVVGLRPDRVRRRVYTGDVRADRSVERGEHGREGTEARGKNPRVVAQRAQR
jgi:glycyl-tRNA synthetase